MHAGMSTKDTGVGTRDGPPHYINVDLLEIYYVMQKNSFFIIVSFPPEEAISALLHDSRGNSCADTCMAFSSSLTVVQASTLYPNAEKI